MGSCKGCCPGTRQRIERTDKQRDTILASCTHSILELQVQAVATVDYRSTRQTAQHFHFPSFATTHHLKYL